MAGAVTAIELLDRVAVLRPATVSGIRVAVFVRTSRLGAEIGVYMQPSYVLLKWVNLTLPAQSVLQKMLSRLSLRWVVAEQVEKLDCSMWCLG